jgi:hypothetical protein
MTVFLIFQAAYGVLQIAKVSGCLKKKADAWEHLLLLLILRQPENQAVGFSPILAR